MICFKYLFNCLVPTLCIYFMVCLNLSEFAITLIIVLVILRFYKYYSTLYTDHFTFKQRIYPLEIPSNRNTIQNTQYLLEIDCLRKIKSQRIILIVIWNHNNTRSSPAVWTNVPNSLFTRKSLDFSIFGPASCDIFAQHKTICTTLDTFNITWDQSEKKNRCENLRF